MGYLGTHSENCRKCIGRISLHYDELNILIIEVESVINSRLLTFNHDDTDDISYPLSPSHLLYGQRMPITANGLYSEAISVHETLTRRAKHHHLVINQFVKHSGNENLVDLGEAIPLRGSIGVPCTPKVK